MTISAELQEKFKKLGLNEDDIKELLSTGANNADSAPSFIPGPGHVFIPSQRDIDEGRAELPEFLKPKEMKEQERLPEIAAYEKLTGEELGPYKTMLFSLMLEMSRDPDYIVGPPWRFRTGVLRMMMEEKGFPDTRIKAIDDDAALVLTKKFLNVFGESPKCSFGKTVESIKGAKKGKEG